MFEVVVARKWLDVLGIGRRGLIILEVQPRSRARDSKGLFRGIQRALASIVYLSQILGSTEKVHGPPSQVNLELGRRSFLRVKSPHLSPKPTSYELALGMHLQLP